MLILDENFRWDFEALASELFIYNPNSGNVGTFFKFE